MDSQLLNLLYKDLNPSSEDFDEEKYLKIIEFENKLENLLEEKDKHLVAQFRINIIDYQDDFWEDISNKFIKRSIMLGMEIQKYIDEIESY